MPSPGRMPSPEQIKAALLAWAKSGGDAHYVAAVDLLTWKGWHRRADFQKAAIRKARDGLYIHWLAARAFHDSGPIGSTTELAILDLAVTLADNRFRLTSMGDAHRVAIVEAVARAMNMDVTVNGPRR